jgi:hypothetical protein
MFVVQLYQGTMAMIIILYDNVKKYKICQKSQVVKLLNKSHGLFNYKICHKSQSSTHAILKIGYNSQSRKKISRAFSLHYFSLKLPLQILDSFDGNLVPPLV